MTDPSKQLTGLQARFVEEYLVDLDAAAAARRAGYSENGARQTGYKNLQKPHIKAAIAQRMEARSRRTEIEADAVIEELARIGFADISEIAEWSEEGVKFIPSEELTPEQTAVIERVKSKRRVRTQDDGTELVTVELEVKLHSKLDALKKLGEHLGLFRDDDRSLRVDVLHWFAGLTPDRLHEIEQASDEELREMFEAKGPASLPKPR